jgi:hypothetical protein
LYPKKTIDERKDLIAYTFIDDLVNEWGSEIILWIDLIPMMEVHTYTNRSLIFVDRNGI